MLPKHPTPTLTHFLCIPLVTTTSLPQLHKSVSIFKGNVSKIKTPELPDGVPERAVRPVGTLHLTLGVMSLTDDKVKGALNLLRSIDIKELLKKESPVKFAEKRKEKEKERNSPEKEQEEEKKPESIFITLQGLRSMSSASKSSILYSSPLDPDLRLYQFCSTLRDLFTEAGFITSDQKKLLLHATILNTVYVKEVKKGGPGHGKRAKSKLVIDAQSILEEYEEMIWMENVRVEKVAVCRMGAKVRVDGEEAYEVEGEIEVPEV